ncbi:MAG: choice-of-anchor L domain-containing protein [Bacteroidales bacterium]
MSTISASGITPQQLVQNVLVGTGVTVSNVKFNGSLLAPSTSNQLGSFTTGASATNLGFPMGIIMATGAISSATNGQTTTAITGTELLVVPELDQYAGTSVIHDAGVLEFDFTPLSDTIKFRYAFGSREYPNFVCSSFNDIFGFFISGMNPTGPNYVNKNIALIPGSNNPVSINTVNGGVSAGSASPCILTNTQYYHTPTPNITYNGLTTVLTAWALVIPCTQYHIKLAIADLGDNAYDSGVFLEANSFSSPQIAIDTTFSRPSASNQSGIEGCNDIILTFKYPYNVPYAYQIPIISVGGTATNGVDYPLLPNMLTIPTGTDSVRLVISPFYDHISEGTETIKLVFQTSTCGKKDTLLFNIINYDSLTAIAYGDTTLCNNHTPLSVIPHNGITPYQYFWNNGAGNSAIVNPTFTATTLYNVTVTDGLCQNSKRFCTGYY